MSDSVPRAHAREHQPSDRDSNLATAREFRKVPLIGIARARAILESLQLKFPSARDAIHSNIGGQMGKRKRTNKVPGNGPGVAASIRRAREVGYLTVTPESYEARPIWYEEARAKGFPLVIVRVESCETPNASVNRVAVMWDVSHLWPAVQNAARKSAKSVADRIPGVSIEDIGEIRDDDGAITGHVDGVGVIGGPLPLEAAKDLASHIVGLTGHRGSAA